MRSFYTDGTIRRALALPGLMINIVFGSIMIGKKLPSVRQIWKDTAEHAILGSVFSFGQFGGLTIRRTILTREAFENAIILHAAVGGSTNALLHIPPITR